MIEYLNEETTSAKKQVLVKDFSKYLIYDSGLTNAQLKYHLENINKSSENLEAHFRIFVKKAEVSFFMFEEIVKDKRTFIEYALIQAQ